MVYNFESYFTCLGVNPNNEIYFLLISDECEKNCKLSKLTRLKLSDLKSWNGCQLTEQQLQSPRTEHSVAVEKVVKTQTARADGHVDLAVGQSRVHFVVASLGLAEEHPVEVQVLCNTMACYQFTSGITGAFPRN